MSKQALDSPTMCLRLSGTTEPSVVDGLSFTGVAHVNFGYAEMGQLQSSKVTWRPTGRVGGWCFSFSK
jgi:hypothetical protein